MDTADIERTERPRDRHPFPVGRKFAVSVGYPRAVLAGLPTVSVDVFCGVSNVATHANSPTGSTGLDALIEKLPTITLLDTIVVVLGSLY